MTQDTPPPGASRFLKLAVLIAGAVLMSLEIVGSRTLAPYFGNSVYVWGSLIGVFLTALSAGYTLGGRLADRWPSIHFLNALAVGASGLLLVIPHLARPCCERLMAAGLAEKTGPLAGSLALFFLPSLLLGMVSPLAIRLVAVDVAGIGTTAGNLYALSTLGSIAGTLLTTFVLIPELGTKVIFKLLCACMAALPLLSLAHGVPARLTAAAGVALMIAAGVLTEPPTIRLSSDQRITDEMDSAYHHILVVDDIVFGTRSLRFGQFYESVIRTDPPYDSVVGYTDALHLGPLFAPSMKTVVFIGAGGGIAPRSFLEHYPGTRIEVVDVDAKVLEVSQKYFHLVPDPSMQLTAADGRMYVQRSAGSYDVIILDAFTIGGRIPFHLTTQEYFGECKARLNPNGVFVMNVNSSLDGPRSPIFKSLHRTLKTVFPQLYIFPLEYRHDHLVEKSRNIILVGTLEGRHLERKQLFDQLTQLRRRSRAGLDFLTGIVADLHTAPVADRNAPLFTDDFAPIDTMKF
jgi:spermidine synthase